MIASFRSIVWVFSGSGELGMMRPLELMVRGEEIREPLMHCRQLIYCVAEVILSCSRPWSCRWITNPWRCAKAILTELRPEFEVKDKHSVPSQAPSILITPTKFGAPPLFMQNSLSSRFPKLLITEETLLLDVFWRCYPHYSEPRWSKDELASLPKITGGRSLPLLNSFQMQYVRKSREHFHCSPKCGSPWPRRTNEDRP